MGTCVRRTRSRVIGDHIARVRSSDDENNRFVLGSNFKPVI